MRRESKAECVVGGTAWRGEVGPSSRGNCPRHAGSLDACEFRSVSGRQMIPEIAEPTDAKSDTGNRRSERRIATHRRSRFG
jgi:hypothetical protein